MNKVCSDHHQYSSSLTQADFNECLQKMIDGHYMVMQALYKLQTKLRKTSFVLDSLQTSDVPSEK